MPGSNVIPFPTTPPFERPRKRGAISTKEAAAHIVTNLPRLMEQVSARIVRDWTRGVRIQALAKMNELTVGQVESVIWLAFHDVPPVALRRAA